MTAPRGARPIGVRRAVVTALLATAIVAGAGACGDGSLAPATVVGRYDLRTVNGRPLPADVGGGSSLDSARLVLRPRGAFTLLRVSEDEAGLEVYTVEGRYEQRARTIAFDGTDSDGESIAFDARVGYNRLTVDVEGTVLVFRK